MVIPKSIVLIYLTDFELKWELKTSWNYFVNLWISERRSCSPFSKWYRNEPVVIEALLPLFKYDIKNLSQKETTEIRDLFNLFDIDGNGSINKKEFRIVMNSLGYNITDGE